MTTQIFNLGEELQILERVQTFALGYPQVVPSADSRCRGFPQGRDLAQTGLGEGTHDLVAAEGPHNSKHSGHNSP